MQRRGDRAHSYTSARANCSSPRGPQPCPAAEAYCAATTPCAARRRARCPTARTVRGAVLLPHRADAAPLPRRTPSRSAACRRPRRHIPLPPMRSSTTSSLRSPRTSSRSAFPAEAHGVEMQETVLTLSSDRARPHGAAIRLRGTRQEATAAVHGQYHAGARPGGAGALLGTLARGIQAGVFRYLRHAAAPWIIAAAWRRAPSCRASGPRAEGGIQEPQPLLARLQAAVRLPPSQAAGGQDK